MNTANLLIAFILFIALFLMERSTQESQITEFSEGVQTDDLERNTQ